MSNRNSNGLQEFERLKKFAKTIETWYCDPINEKMVLQRTGKKLLVTHLYISRSLELGRRFKL